MGHRNLKGKKVSAGLLAYRLNKDSLECLIVHPGGPHNKNRDLGAWSIPKGKVEDDETPYEAAFREFEEEVGFHPLKYCTGTIFSLGEPVEQPKKFVYAWAFEYNGPKKLKIKSNLTTMEFPYGSGKIIEVPEIDQGLFMDPEMAKKKIHPAQSVLIDRLQEMLNDGFGTRIK